jgi:hypothetical protein
VEASPSERLERWVLRLSVIEPALYALWAAGCTLSSAETFYGYMMKQTRGEWSAPLDDVFIHFDYARATAQGHPFEWIAGNGYSSGNTSLSYPFVLAVGYLAGFTGQRLMLWAAILAATATFGVLLAGRSLFVPRVGPTSPFDRLSSYLLPPLFLGVGALDWTLWSGMEVAFFLATWACALLAYFSLIRARARDVVRRSWALGMWGLLMVVTRPEAATTLLIFGLGAAWVLTRRIGRRAFGVLVRIGTPGAVALLVQALANRLLTGEWSAAGAIVKLAIYNPFMTAADKWNDYVFNLRYEIFRNIEYHFTDQSHFGFILPGLALASVAVKRTRGLGLLLLGQVTGWALLVALNGQVRWQNERYTMPAVAWLLMAAALGASALLRRRERPSTAFVFATGVLAVHAVVASLAPEARPALGRTWVISAVIGASAAAFLRVWPIRLFGTFALLGLFQLHQAPNMRGQKWFFGRACRNILDQHITAGRFLDTIGARRVLVGDAGALIYASGRKGLDIIGLGGYRSLPFARAGLMGLSSTIELMEHVPPQDRPDVLAIYPSWWGILPTWFGGPVIGRFPAEGNVICGGYEDVLYRADWQLLGTGEAPRVLKQIAAAHPGVAVRDQVDVADLLSEADHDYRFDAPASGFTDMKILPDPVDDTSDMLDGGRIVRAGNRERMRIGKLLARRPAWIIVRSAPVNATDLVVRVDEHDVDTIHWTAGQGWVEASVEIPEDRVAPELRVELVNQGPEEFFDYHVWVVQ